MDASLPNEAQSEGSGHFASAELDKQLVNADRLLAYAAEVGKAIDASDRDAVLEAKAARLEGAVQLRFEMPEVFVAGQLGETEKPRGQI